MFLNIINNLTNMDKNSRFLLIIIAIISFLLVLIFIFNFLSSRKEKKLMKQKKAYKKRLIEEINKEAINIKPTEKIKITKNVENKVQDEEIEEIIDEEDDEVLEVINDENESDVDRILREIKKSSKEESLNLTEFEKEQEETAIISYDELCKRAGVKKKIYKAKDNNVSNSITKTINNEEKKYKPSKIVSPIYGIQDEKNKDDGLNLEETFLKSLKEFRSSLD